MIYGEVLSTRFTWIRRRARRKIEPTENRRLRSFQQDPDLHKFKARVKNGRGARSYYRGHLPCFDIFGQMLPPIFPTTFYLTRLLGLVDVSDHETGVV